MLLTTRAILKIIAGFQQILYLLVLYFITVL